MLKITILGAGPAGLAAAWRLFHRKDIDTEITVVEKLGTPGGGSGSFEKDGLFFDFGSHRLHPGCRPDILKDIRHCLNEDLLLRRRNGRIRFKNGYLRFPLSLTDLVFHSPPGFKWRIARETLAGAVGRDIGSQATFRDVLLFRMGKTLSEEFYFPYARKIWGLEPELISAKQAEARMGPGGIRGFTKKIFARMGTGQAGKVFFYPRKGIGQIFDRIASELERLGVRIRYDAEVTRIDHSGGRVTGITVEGKSGPKQFESDLVLSTIPIQHAVDRLNSPVRNERCGRLEPLTYRALTLLYMTFRSSRFTEFDAHYFPEENYCFSRISEPSVYSDTRHPDSRTGICVEIPCDITGDPVLTPVEKLAERVMKEMRMAGLAHGLEPDSVFREILPFAYPVYRLGYESSLHREQEFIEGIDGLVTLGRNGLFTHINMHHSMEMGYDAASCILPDGRWDGDMWERCRTGYDAFVVED